MATGQEGNQRLAIRTTVPEASSTQSLPLATVMLPGPETGMLAVNRPRSKAGTVTPVGVGGGWIDRGLLAVSAAPEHPAVATRTATTSSFWQRGARRGDGRRLTRAGVTHLPPRTPG
jgi:hypothetical protein